MSEVTLSASVVVHASPRAVYDLVSDVPGMPRWAAECDRCTWLGDADGPRVGARFRGRNSSGRRRWWTTATVTAAEEGRRFAFRVTSLGMPVSAWAYDIEPGPEGCVVTESTWYQAGFLLRRVLAPLATGSRGRAHRLAANERNIARTLAQLKVAAETSGAAGP